MICVYLRGGKPEQMKTREESTMSVKLGEEAERIMNERFGKDSIIALATEQNGIPYVRFIDAYYENGCFYAVTDALSNKMKQIEQNPVVAVSGQWFTAHGKGVNAGAFGKAENRETAEKMKEVFSEWITNGHTDLSDENTIILRIELTHGLLLSDGTRYEF